MTHPDENAVAAFVHGRASAPQANAIQEHVAQCEECRQLVSALARELGPAGPEQNASVSGPTVPSPEVGAPAVRLGTTVSRYALLNMIGSGGMGVVYAAYDPQLDRRVALKLMRSEVAEGSSPGEARARMLREAQAMARLSHPNVVGVHDVGTYEGHIFVTMEFVEGLNLMQWLKAERRPWLQILDAFFEAGEGLFAAHAAGLIHRDFKPENVFVGKDGRVRVGDFGLARHANLPKEPPLDIAGTPAYMAPEQFRGEQLDHRADQYSFCVALHEALFGMRPQGPLETTTPEGLSAAARKPSGSSPSFTAADIPAAAARRIRKALARGLSVSPEQRFASMRALLFELRRVRPRSWRRAWIAAAAALAGLTLGAAGIEAWRVRAAACRGAEDRLVGVWDGPTRASAQRAFRESGRPYAAFAWTSVAREMDDFAGSWVRMRTDACRATLVRGEQSPELMDLRMQCLDLKLARFQATSSLFVRADERVLLKAADLAGSLPALADCADPVALRSTRPLPEDKLAREKISKVRAALARASVLESAGKFSEGLALASSSAADALGIDYLPAQAEALWQRGKLEDDQGQLALAEGSLARAAHLADAAGADPLRARALLDLAWTVGHEQKQLTQGQALLEDAAAVTERLRASGKPVSDLLRAKSVLALDRGRPDEALKLLDQAVRVLRHEDPNHPALAPLLNNRAAALAELGRDDQAEAAFKEVLATYEKRVGTDYPLYADTLMNLGTLLHLRGRYEEAVQIQRRALEILKSTVGPRHPDVASALLHLGDSLRTLHQELAAQQALEESLAIDEEQFGKEHPALIPVLQAKSRLAVDSGRSADALVDARRALQIALRFNPEDSAAIADARTYLADALSANAQLKQARSELALALAVDERSGQPSIVVAGVWASIGDLQLQMREFDQAQRSYAQALNLLGEPAANLNDQAHVQFGLARALWESPGNQARAVALGQAAVSADPAAGGEGEAAQITDWLKTRAPR